MGGRHLTSETVGSLLAIGTCRIGSPSVLLWSYPRDRLLTSPWARTCSAQVPSLPDRHSPQRAPAPSVPPSPTPFVLPHLEPSIPFRRQPSPSFPPMPTRILGNSPSTFGSARPSASGKRFRDGPQPGVVALVVPVEGRVAAEVGGVEVVA